MRAFLILLRSRRINQILALIISTCFVGGCHPALAQEEPQWLFPEDSLPQDLGSVPLFVSDDERAEIQTPRQDWFLLRDPISLAGELILRDVGPLGQSTFLHPRLNEQNAQIYFRIMVGLILQETLAHSGFTPAQAEAFRRAGAEAELSNQTLQQGDQRAQMVRLPESLEQLKRQWANRRLELENSLPRWLEPLAIAVETSGLQHFATPPSTEVGGPVAGPTRKQCFNFDELSPLKDGRARMRALEEERLNLSRELEERAIIIELTQTEARKLLQQARQLPDQLQNLNDCRDLFIGFRDEAPVQQSLRSVRTVSQEQQQICMSELSLLLVKDPRENRISLLEPLKAQLLVAQSESSSNFLGPSLRLRQGQQDLIQVEEQLRLLQTQALETEQLSVEEERKQQSQLSQERELRELQQGFDVTNRILVSEIELLRDEASQIILFRALIDRTNFVRSSIERLPSKEALLVDLHDFLQDYRAQLMSRFASASVEAQYGLAFKLPVTREELDLLKSSIVSGLASDETLMALMNLLEPWSKRRVEVLESELAERQQLLDLNMSRIQLVSTQLETLSTMRIDSLKTEISRRDLPNPDELRSRLNKLEVDRAVTLLRLQELEDELLTLNSVIDIFRNEVFVLRGQLRDLFQKSSEEQQRAIELSEALKLEQAQVEGRLAPIDEELNNIKLQLAQYLDPQKMGWMFEQNCQLFDREVGLDHPQVYIARAPLSSNANQASDHWGLFHFRYDSFSQAIHKGALLDLKQTVRLGVHSVDRLSTQLRLLLAQERTQGTTNCANSNVSQPQNNLEILQKVKQAWLLGANESDLISSLCTPRMPAGTSITSAAQLLQWRGSFLDQVLPKRGQARAEDLVERQLLELLTSELSTWSGSGENSATDSWPQWQEAILAVLATDYDELIHRLNTEVPEGFARFRFASDAPPQQTHSAGRQGPSIEIGDQFTIQTMREVPLFEAPVVDDATQLAMSLSYRDQVEIEPIRLSDTEFVGERGGWVRVRVLSRGEPQVIAWMGASALAQGYLELPNGELADLNRINCPSPREVRRLENFQRNDLVVTRMLGGKNIPLTTTTVVGAQQMSWAHQDRATDTFLNRRHIACELLEIEGAVSATQPRQQDREMARVMGVRIIEALEWQSPSGERYLIPLEEEGGFVHPFLLGRNATTSRIELGAPISPSEGWRIQGESR